MAGYTVGLAQKPADNSAVSLAAKKTFACHFGKRLHIIKEKTERAEEKKIEQTKGNGVSFLCCLGVVKGWGAQRQYVLVRLNTNGEREEGS